jgi:iron complex outermembrane receptor protein
VCVCSSAFAEVEEITVTAQRRAANLQEVPVSVSAFSAEDIARLQIDLAQDISVNVPNMKMYTVTAGGSAMQVFMRGAGVQNPGFNASESPVGIYEDDIYRGRLATANLDLTDVERIEVLRGPQGTLYGRNTIAGAVKIISRTPGDDFWANASVGAGDYETTKVTASVGGPLMEGKLAGSVAGIYHNRDEGWISRGPDRVGDFGDPISSRELGEYDNKSFRSKLHWYAGDVFDAELSLGYVDADNDGYNAIPYGPAVGDAFGTIPPSVPGQPLQGFYDTLVPDNSTGNGETKQKNAGLKLSWDLGSVTLQSITGYSDIDDEFRFDLSGGAFQIDADTVAEGVPFFLINSDSNNKTFSQEFTASGVSLGDKLDWIAGVFYMNEDGDQTYNPSGGGEFLNEQVHTETDSYAVFAEGTWAYTDKLALTLGGRWSRDEKEYSNNCTDSGGVFPACTNNGYFLPLEEDYNEFTPRAILEYQAADNVMVFGSVSKGFQAGGFQTLCFGNQACNELTYGPQKVWSWETGIKSDFFENSVRINASAFYAQYDDIQQTVVAGGAFPTLNAGDADVTGVEIEAYWTPIRQLNLFAIYGYANEDIDSATEAAIGSDKLPGLARTTVRLGADFRTPVFGAWDFLIGVDMNYSDEYLSALTANPDWQLTVDDYTRYNGRIGLDQPEGHWSAILSGTNITDEEDLYSGIAAQGINIRTPQPPREYMFTVNYRY